MPKFKLTYARVVILEREIEAENKHNAMDKATELASNEYWDGHNFERHEHNTFLYKGKNGRYFSVHLTMWQGERDTIESLSLEEAKSLYESLPEHEVEYEEAFGIVPQEA